MTDRTLPHDPYITVITSALTAAVAAGMPVGIDLDGTLTDRNAWSVVWDAATKRWTVTGYDEDVEEQPTPADFTEARVAFMNLGRTPSLQGLRTELRIEGRPVLVSQYAGAEMGRMHDVPGYERVLSVKPQILFEYADAPAAEEPAACTKCRAPFDPGDTRHDGHAQHRGTPYCRRCVDACHDNEIADHRCVICA